MHFNDKLSDIIRFEPDSGLFDSNKLLHFNERITQIWEIFYE